MDDESKKMLAEAVELVRENNQILQSLQRSMRISRVIRIIYWVLIIGSTVGAFFVIQPWLDQLLDVYSGAGDVIQNFKNITQ